MFTAHQSALSSWVSESLAHAAWFSERDTMLRSALQIANPCGLFCEFGVADGNSLLTLALARPDLKFHGFDSFYGLPEDGRSEWPKGRFTRHGEPPPVADNVVLHIGLFDRTIPVFLSKHPNSAAFLHIDCDLYSSAKTVLTLMSPRIVPGTLIQFDEFYNFEGWEDASEAKAFYECLQETGHAAKCIAMVPDREQVLFRIEFVRPSVARLLRA